MTRIFLIVFIVEKHLLVMKDPVKLFFFKKYLNILVFQKDHK